MSTEGRPTNSQGTSRQSPPRAALSLFSGAFVAVLVLVGFGACGPKQLPPLGEVLVVVDTDAVVPALVSRLRVDAYTSSGVWYDSRDFGLEEPAQWPASFGVYSPTAGQGGAVTLRLRGYADGKIRDYRGERYQARPQGGPPSQIVETPSPPPGEAPRLIGSDGSDKTPATEPEPLLAIDALIQLTIPSDVVKLASVVLRGACFGTMANLLALETCVDTENVLVSVPSPALGTDLTLPTRSLEGHFGAPVACKATPRPNGVAPDGTPLYDEEVCVDGGTFVFGRYPNDFPERIAIVEPFLMDKYEVTVAAFRQALLHGLPSTDTPPENASPIPSTADYEAQAGLPFCTYSATPMGREDFPVSCLVWSAAQAFCQFEGGDLPSEVQWEWVVAAAGRTNKTVFPWGGPDEESFPCSHGDFGRGYVANETPGPCLAVGLGPAPVKGGDHPGGDRSVGFGLVDLGYNMMEWQKDEFQPLDSRCWMDQPLHATACSDPANVSHTVRGGSWHSEAFQAGYPGRSAAPSDASSTEAGFRCVRKAVP
jgi:formylglycine-generating enzyme required for sulfatase activity